MLIFFEFERSLLSVSPSSVQVHYSAPTGHSLAKRYKNETQVSGRFLNFSLGIIYDSESVHCMASIKVQEYLYWSAGDLILKIYTKFDSKTIKLYRWIF